MTKNDFCRKWLKNFSNGISKKDMQKYVVSPGNFIWHVFSWELLDKKSFLAGDDAKSAYNKADKNNVLYIEWFKDDIPHFLPPTMHTANALDNMTEVYVVASDFSWTYIKTHESMCGPYFMKL